MGGGSLGRICRKSIFLPYDAWLRQVQALPSTPTLIYFQPTATLSHLFHHKQTAPAGGLFVDLLSCRSLYAFVFGFSDSHLRKFWGCVICTKYFPVWHFWKLESDWHGVSPAHLFGKGHVSQEEPVTAKQVFILMSPNCNHFLYEEAGFSFFLSGWHGATFNVFDHLMRQQRLSAPSSLTLTTSFLSQLLWKRRIRSC